jgi:antitoxin (DNA-binding transcriptional repressor) of toxin-antitoxin stability system
MKIEPSITLCHHRAMKEIAINEMHSEAAAWLRQALLDGQAVITERKEPLAMLVPLRRRGHGKPLPNREAWIQSLPLTRDSGEIVS